MCTIKFDVGEVWVEEWRLGEEVINYNFSTFNYFVLITKHHNLHFHRFAFAHSQGAEALTTRYFIVNFFLRSLHFG